MRSFRPSMQSLETRQLMAGDAFDFNHMADRFEQEMLRINSAVNSVQTVESLPVIGDYFDGQRDVVDLQGGVGSEIAQVLRSLDPQSSKDEIREELFNRLDALGYLGDTDKNGSIDNQDVSVKIDSAKDEVEIKMRLTHETMASAASTDFDLGLKSVPIEFRSTGDLVIGVEMDYEELKFGMKNGVFKMDHASTEDIKINLSASLANPELYGRMGFMEFTARQQDAPGAKQTGLTATLSLDVTKTDIDWKIYGTADVHFDMYAGFVGKSETAPSIGTDFDFNWQFAEYDPSSGGASWGNAPELSLNNVRLRLGEVLTNIVRPWLREVQKVTDPLQPVVDFLNTRIPGISDLSETFGQGEVTVIQLVEKMAAARGETANFLPDAMADQERQWVSMLKTAATLTDAIDMINALDAAAGNFEIVLGSFDVTGGAAGDLRRAADALPDKMGDGLTSLLDLDDVEGTAKKIGEAIDELQNVPDAIKDQFKKTSLDLKTNFKISTPVLTAKPWALALLGKESDLLRLDVGFNLDTEGSQRFIDFYGLGVGLGWGLDVNAKLGVGYDTRGLLDSDLLDGFYIDTESELTIKGNVQLEAGVDVAIASAQITGGISTAGTDLRLGFGDHVIDGKLRPSEISKLSAGEIFLLSGKLQVEAALEAHLGIDTPFGFAGVKERYVFAKKTILDLNRDISNGDPWNSVVQPQLASLQPGGELVLHVGVNQSHRGIENGQANENYRILQFTDENGIEITRVSAFGTSEFFSNVTRISADFADGDDLVMIDKSVTSEVHIQLGSGNDEIRHRGSGQAWIDGNEGDDSMDVASDSAIVYGGKGDDYIRMNQSERALAFGGDGDDTLVGGGDASRLSGDRGHDRLVAGRSSQELFGSTGDDIFDLSSGEALVYPGAGANQVNWHATGGNAFVDTNGETTVVVSGDKNDDRFVVAGNPSSNPSQHHGTIGIVSEWSNRTLEMTPLPTPVGIEVDNSPAPYAAHVVIEGREGADEIHLTDMAGTELRSFAVNVGQELYGDGAADHVVIDGTSRNDVLTLDKTEYYSSVKPDSENPDGGFDRGPLMTGGITSIDGLSGYRVTVGNSGDQLDVMLDSGNDIVAVEGISGDTTIFGAAGLDQLNVNPDEFDDLLGELHFDGGAHQSVVRFNSIQMDGIAEVDLSDEKISGELISEVDGLTYRMPIQVTADVSQGSLRSMDVRLGDGDDSVTLGSNGTAAPIRVATGAGDDMIQVGHDTFSAANTTGYSVYGGSGQNQLRGADANNRWRIVAPREVELNGTTFHHIDQLMGGGWADEFAFNDGVKFWGSLDGDGGRNSLDYSAWRSGVDVNLLLGEASNVGDGVENIQDFVGGSGNDLFIGDDQSNMARGGAGRDVLIGGDGDDDLAGGADEDVLIGESTQADHDTAYLRDFTDRWAANADPSELEEEFENALRMNLGNQDQLFDDGEDWLLF